MTMTIVSLQAVTGTVILAGRLLGQEVRPIVEKAARGALPGSLFLLDFGKAELLTSSFFLGALEWIWATSLIRDHDLFPMLANAAEDVWEEIDLVLKAKGLKSLYGSWRGGEDLRDVNPLNLDKMELETYRRVENLGEATAAELYSADPTILSTAWSNRLAVLFEYRLLRRRKEGRQLVYSVCWR